MAKVNTEKFRIHLGGAKINIDDALNELYAWPNAPGRRELKIYLERISEDLRNIEIIFKTMC